MKTSKHSICLQAGLKNMLGWQLGHTIILLILISVAVIVVPPLIPRALAFWIGLGIFLLHFPVLFIFGCMQSKRHVRHLKEVLEFQKEQLKIFRELDTYLDYLATQVSVHQSSAAIEEFLNLYEKYQKEGEASSVVAQVDQLVGALTDPPAPVDMTIEMTRWFRDTVRGEVSNKVLALMRTEVPDSESFVKKFLIIHGYHKLLEELLIQVNMRMIYTRVQLHNTGKAIQKIQQALPA